MSVDEAKALWLNSFKEMDIGSEIIESMLALHRVTSEPVVALASSPHYAASAMDGFAVLAERTIGAAPGRPIELKIDVDCFPVDTGDPLPSGTDAVIMVEHVQISAASIVIEQPVSPWQHVRPVGEDIVATEVLLPRFRKISPVDIGAMLAASVLSVSVLKRPKVAVIPTGDELVDPGSKLKPGDVVEYNSHIIRHTLSEWGCEVHVSPSVRDDKKLLVQTFRECLQTADIVMVIAGSSTGRGDFTSDVLQECGELIVHGVAMRPGKPVMLGVAQGKPVVGLPGYPVSAYLCLELFVKPLVYMLQHQALLSHNKIEGVLSRRLVSPMGVQEYVRVTIGQVGGRYVVTPLGRGAGVVTSLVKADGYVLVPASSEGYAEGENVVVRLQSEGAIDNGLVCIGSHDLALDTLGDLLVTRHGHRLKSSHVGSMGGIMALKRGESHFGGIHLLDSSSGKYNVPFVKRYFPDEEMLILNLVGRVQGLIIRPDDTKCIASWNDLVNCRFVNRQRGAGTRLLLDYHLAQEGIDPQQINGYEREETTHLAVACAVQAGEADAGLGILPAAKAFGLGFIPLALEQFDLLLYKKDLKDPRIANMIEVIRSKDFKDAVEVLGGYDTSRTGQIVWEG